MSNLWLEKYRPIKINDVISQNDIITIFNNIKITKQMPNLLLYGSPGTGKTSIIIALCKELYGLKKYSNNVLELNASDERGINVVREKIINFACETITTPDENYPSPNFKIIILDEAEAMTKDAQSALRRVIEEYSEITRFCFICNNIHQIIEPIISRCIKLKFKTIKEKEMIKRLKYISEIENIKISEETLSILYSISNGDMRKGILFLQNYKYSNSIIKTKDIYEYYKYISYEKMEKYINIIKNNKDIETLLNITNKIINEGYLYYSIINQYIKFVLEMDITDKYKSIILYDLSDIEKYINNGGDEYIQLLKILNNIRIMLVDIDT